MAAPRSGQHPASIPPGALEALDRRLIERYSARLQHFGRDPRTLGWDSVSSQRARFALAADCLDFRGRSVLDVGCGLGHFREFLYAAPSTTPATYTGFDINPDLIGECRRAFPDSTFEARNILLDPPSDRRWDIVVMFGLLNLRLEDVDNKAFALALIEGGFALSEEGLAVDMLSDRRDLAYPREDFVYYYDPSELLDLALGLTPHVLLRHDHRSIPQREFLLILRRTAWAT
ncbi:MAG: class I SAM-dependent methyltransferase [Alphaproteobacteria bacterium]